KEAVAMIKSASLGIGPKIVETNSEQPAANNVTTQTPVETQPSVQIKAANTSIDAESQMSSSALKEQLQNELTAKMMDNQIKCNDVSLKSPLTANENQWKANPELKRFKLPDKSEASNWGYLPKTLATGDGDDKVDIKMGSDGRVHVNVNGKE